MGRFLWDVKVGNETTLLWSRPIRTERATFTALRSSLFKANFGWPSYHGSFGACWIMGSCFDLRPFLIELRLRSLKYSVKRGSYGVASALILMCLLIATELASNKSTNLTVSPFIEVFAKKIQFLSPWLRKYFFFIHKAPFPGCLRQTQLHKAS